MAEGEREATLELDAVGRPADARIGRGDVVILAVKSHQTAAALQDLRAAAPGEIPVACAQNGVANERMALKAHSPLNRGFLKRAQALS